MSLRQARKSCIDPALCQNNPYPNQPLITVSTHGACVKADTVNAKTRGGFWFSVDSIENTALRIELEGAILSKELGSIAAALYAAHVADPMSPLLIRASLKNLIEDLTTHLKSYEDVGWIGVVNTSPLKQLVARLRERSAPTYLDTLKPSKHPSKSKAAIKLATEGAAKPVPDDWMGTVNDCFALEGASLPKLTQRLAYQGIRALANPLLCRKTTINLDITCHAIEEVRGKLPTDTLIWRNLKNPAIPRNIRVFLWKMMHGGNKCGDYWTKMTNLEHWGTCLVCGEEASITHILLKCSLPGCGELWALAENLWAKGGNSWPSLTSIGLIARATFPLFKTMDGKPDTGANCLYTILITETAFLIWKIRGEQVFQRGSDQAHWHTPEELRNHLQGILSLRLELER